MVRADKAENGKAKALATASTLQKVVCPAPETDPQEILSHGWRKVGEQKRVTNRLANGNPDRGMGISSRTSSFFEPADRRKQQNGRQVLDKMFGHMRPHHIITSTAVLRNEDEELKNGLGTQAARAAFFRPAIAPVLNELTTPPNHQHQHQQSPAEALGVGTTTASNNVGVSTSANPSVAGSAAGVAGAGAGAGAGGWTDGSSARPAAPASPLRVNNAAAAGPHPHAALPGAKAQHGQGDGLDSSSADVAGGCGGGSSEGDDSSRTSGGLHGGSSPNSASFSRRLGGAAANHFIRQESTLRRVCSGLGLCSPTVSGGSVTGGSLAGGGSSGAAVSAHSGGSSTNISVASGHMSSPRTGIGVGDVRRGTLPAVFRSYPSDSGATVAVAASPVSCNESPRLPAALGAIAAAAAAAPAGSSNASPRRQRRASISGDTSLPAIGPGGGFSAAGAPGGGGKVYVIRNRRASLTGGQIPGGVAAAIMHLHPRRTSLTGGVGGGGGGGGMPHVAVRSSHSGVYHGGNGGGGHGSPLRLAGRGGGGGGGRGDMHDSPNSPTPAAPASSARGASHLSGGDGHAGSTVHGHLAGSFRIGGSGGSGGVAADATAAPAAPAAELSGVMPPVAGVNPAVPLSGLEDLAGTGLADAISELRRIRMGVMAPPREIRERKVEPGLAGVSPLQLLAVPLPPLDNWQSGGRQTADLDPCKGIRLVDTANCVLPRPTAEANLQVRMAQHQAAMRHLVKAEGAPMSEIEMDAAKLLGRLERSGARHRNLESMNSEKEPLEREEDAGS